MNIFASSLTVLAAAAAPLFITVPAHAAALTWVSGTGSDAGVCPRSAPCRTYTYAFSQTNLAGEINCATPGNFGTLIVTRSVSIVCDSGGDASGINTNSFLIDAPANSIITLKGLNMDCGFGGFAGIKVQDAGVVLHVHDVQIRNCHGDANHSLPAAGIHIVPSSDVTEVYVADSYITDNGNAGSEAGILIKPTGFATVRVHVDRTLLENNQNGIMVDAPAGGGGVRGAIRDSAVAGSTSTGIRAHSAGALVLLLLTNVAAQGNNTGISAFGSGAEFVVDKSQITANGTGVSAIAPARIYSYGNNNNEWNSTNGAFSGITPLR